MDYRKFQTQKVWVRDTLITETLKFRKMNRFSPLIIDKVTEKVVNKATESKTGHGKTEKLLIQGNAMDAITAYDLESGKIEWRIPIRNGVETSAVHAGGKLFFGANDGQFYAVEAISGKVLWTYPVKQEVLSEPLVHDDVVYFLSGANTLYALAADTGKSVWLYNRQDPSQLSVRGGSKPAIRGNTLYVGFSDGTLIAFATSNGSIKWEKKLNKNKKFRDLDSAPLVDEEFLYVLGYDDAVYCLRSASGEMVWKTNFGGYGSILKQGDRIFLASTSEEFVALNAESGKKIWSIPTKEGIATGASLLRGLVVFGDSLGEVHFVEPGSGRKVGSFHPGSGVHAAPTSEETSGMLYFISNEANLYALKVGWARASDIPFLR